MPPPPDAVDARIVLVRHGSTRATTDRRYPGTDEPLDAVGRAEADALAAELGGRGFGRAISSGARRADETLAAILAAAGGGPTVDADARWLEANHGRWTGLTYDEVAARWPDEAAARYEDPLDGRAGGGESLREVAARVGAAWRELVTTARGRVVVVTHATPIRVVVAAVHGRPLDAAWDVAVPPGSLTELEVAGGAIRVVDVGRLPGHAVVRA